MNRDDAVHDVSYDGVLPSLAIAAHELKSPLALMRQLSLSLESGELSVSDRVETIHHLRLVSEKSLRLTSDLTKSYQLKDSLFDTEPLHAGEVCEDVVREIKPLYRACDRDIVIAGRRTPLLVVAHRDFLRRVLLNYVDNALHYGDPENPVEISFASLHGGSRVRFSVRDYGPSVPMDIWKGMSLGRPEQIHSRPEGSGLGLMIAKTFAEAMGGEVGLIRHRDGASFHVDLHASRQLSLV